jgi:glutamyl-tRNA synthetase
MLIYKAMEEPLPQYAHVPMILGPDRQRLSKRHGAVSVLAYRDMGYLPQALLNSLARLGWSSGDQEKFTIDELIEKFSLTHVGKSAGIFNSEKMLDLNAWYIRESSDESLARDLIPFLQQLGFESLDKKKVKEAVATVKERSKTLADMAERARFYFQEEINYEKKGDDKFLTPDVLGLLEDLQERLERTSEFNQGALEHTLATFLNQRQIKLKRVAQPLRVALTGKTASPGIFEVMEVLGKEKVLKRLSKAIVHIRAKR